MGAASSRPFLRPRLSRALCLTFPGHEVSREGEGVSRRETRRQVRNVRTATGPDRVSPSACPMTGSGGRSTTPERTRSNREALTYRIARPEPELLGACLLHPADRPICHWF